MSLGWQIRELGDKEEIRQYLNADRLYSAYALGDLEPSLFPLCRWWLAERMSPAGPGDWALVLHYRGLTPNAVICVGEPVAAGALLAQVPLPDTIHLMCRPEHMQPAGAVLELQASHHMARMVLSPERFRPAPADDVLRLAPDRLADLQALYAADPDAADAFAPYQLEQGIFFGAEVEERLVSAAGTHLVAPTERIGAIGNVFTLPSFRGQGYASACTSAACSQLLARGLTTVLNVGTANLSAIRVYERLGFESYCTYFETVAKTKGETR